MSLPVMACLAVAALALGYTIYGRFIARQYRLDPGAVTPAVAVNDGIDFVPTRPFYLLGQHFSAIAAAGPIAGPILACQQFGWLPCLLWIGLGVVFIGAVHDFSSLIASVRHRGQSIAEIVKDSLGRRAWLAIMLFIWLALIYVIVAFTQITASTFVSGGDLPLRIADGANPPLLQILASVDQVDDCASDRIINHAVDCKIASPDVFFQAAIAHLARPAPVQIRPVVPKTGDLERLALNQHQDDAELRPDRERFLE